jgi:hypothetical protein
MKNKARIMLAVHHRDKNSLRGRREALGLGAFHWSLLIVPRTSTGPDCRSFDVTDSAIIDPVRSVDLNPNHDWRFRDERVNPMALHRLLVLGMVGKLDDTAADSAAADAVSHILRGTPVPQNGRTPRENCVSWLKRGVQRLQHGRVIQQMDLDEAFGDLFSEAIRRLDAQEVDSTNVLNFCQSRPCDVTFQ